MLANGSENRSRVTAIFGSRFKRVEPLHPACRKNSACTVGQISGLSLRVLLHKRGVSRSSRTLAAGCDGRVGVLRRSARMRTAKACGPDLPTLGSSLARRFARRRWLSSPVHRGERAISRKPLCRECRMFRLTCSFELVCFFTAHEAMGAAERPAFPAPSLLSRADDDASPGHIRAAGMWSHAQFRRVGKAKRATIGAMLSRGGGHGAFAPLPTLRHRAYIRLRAVAAADASTTLSTSSRQLLISIASTG